MSCNLTSALAGAMLAAITPGVCAQQQFFAVEFGTGDLYQLTTADSTLNIARVGATGIKAPGSLDFGRAAGALYSVSVNSPSVAGARTPSLYRIDPATGLSNIVGSLGVDFTLEGGLAIRDETTAYAIGNRIVGGVTFFSSTLYTIDLTTGAATALGDIGPIDANALVLRDDGTLISYGGAGTDHLSSRIYEINPDTLETRVMSDTTITTLGGTGGATIASGSAWYLSSTEGVHTLTEIDPVTGELRSRVSTVLGGGAFRFSGLAVPAPGSMTLLALAGVIATRRRRSAS